MTRLKLAVRRWAAGAAGLLLATGCMHRQVTEAVSETNAAMLAPLLGGPSKPTSETGAKLLQLIELNDGNPAAANRLRVRHAMLYTTSKDPKDEPIAWMSWKLVDENHLSGRELELYRCRGPLIFWFQNSEKKQEFWEPDVQAQLGVISGHVSTLDSSIDRLKSSPSARLYLANIRIQMQNRALAKRSLEGQQVQAEATQVLVDYIALHSDADIAAVKSAAATANGSEDAFDQALLGGAASAASAYEPYLIASRIRKFRKEKLLGQFEGDYAWVNTVP